MNSRDHDLHIAIRNNPASIGKKSTKSKAAPAVINGIPLAKGMNKKIAYFDASGNIQYKNEFHGYHSNALSYGKKIISQDTKPLKQERLLREKSAKNKRKEYRAKFLKLFRKFFSLQIKPDGKHNYFLLPFSSVVNFHQIRALLDDGIQNDFIAFYEFIKYTIRKPKGIYFLTNPLIFEDKNGKPLEHGLSVLSILADLSQGNQDMEFLSYLDAMEKTENRLNLLISQHESRIANDLPMPVYTPKNYKHVRQSLAVDRDILGNNTSIVVLPSNPIDVYIKRFFSMLPNYYKIYVPLLNCDIYSGFYYPSLPMDYFRKF